MERDIGIDALVFCFLPSKIIWRSAMHDRKRFWLAPLSLSHFVHRCWQVIKPDRSLNQVWCKELLRLRMDTKRLSDAI